MQLKKIIGQIKLQYNNPELRKSLPKAISKIPFWISLISIFTIIYDFGFDQSNQSQHILNEVYKVALYTGIASMVLRYSLKKQRPKVKAWPYDLLLLAITSLVLFNLTGHWDVDFFQHWNVIYSTLFLLFIREFSTLQIDINRRFLNPAQLFVLSFSVIIISGALLLMLPRATHEGISFMNALFTATSAVCVTGLAVVDTGQYFTVFGQTIIIVLIQIGGLGIMTFTSYFSYFFRGGASYENQLQLQEMTNTERIADVFSTLKKIIILTFLIEALGAIFIYFSLDKALFESGTDRTFFAIFHSISAFCNAGFSTLSNSLYQVGFRFNYPLHLIVSGLFIIGGLGFPIIFNSYNYFKHILKNRIFAFNKERRKIHVPWVVNINTRIVLITTIILLVSATGMFLLFEFDNTLGEHNFFGKVVTAFFGAATPRTAGFNSIDTAAMAFPTIMLVMLLMWIGASPGSTGGGIKTSTIAVATLNYLSVARGKDRIEVFNREVGQYSVRRAFAIISLSLVVIGAAIFLISYFEDEMTLMSIAFECFSAYSTSGLSLGITADLSAASKLVIIGTMFIGRVSMLTILIAILKRANHLAYRYPTEEISIN